ncbi:hypothetical protein FHS79_000012 [Polymorphobacter multimanifer]|uniref:Glycosyltransferase family 2 protein n=1 Tax=Polymorphobacter multimanifer TaxID=1070431 RepID=A0A841L357_9SPHN|nr:glycosyltransferase family 2 protein [Polymorphobacter multimanifer]MBB6225861.1 hypothetical protein [Polymorphobacter multimanifer]
MSATPLRGMSATPPLGIVLVNYGRWQDSIECLESVFRSDCAVRVVVVDNASPDDSFARIAAWARGAVEAGVDNPALAHFSQPPLPKPIAHECLLPEALAGAVATASLTIVQSGANLGFAGGNNIGMRLLLADPAVRHIWLLNNDTVIAPDAASILDRTMAETPGIGMAGTTVRFYHRPDTVQAWAGNRFSALTGQARGIGHGDPATPVPTPDAILPKVDFILGASLAVSRGFLERVGLMEDSYFLYYEEIDWAVRNRRLGREAFATAWAAQAQVFHKEGGSIGSSGTKSQRSSFSEYWLNRSRLAFIGRHYPLLLPLHWLLTLVLIGRRLVRGQPAKAESLSRALFGRAFSS